ncbi:MAG TPA: hypothetical protein ENJ46_06435, partial [Hellea balneolensis]|nr:hypothetical protein [Hellea balneolensis]
LAHFFVRSEPLTPIKLLGFVVGFCGVVLLFLPKQLGWGLVENWQAQALIIIAAFGYAATSILGKRAPEQPASVGAALMLIGGAVSALISAFIFAPDSIPHSWPPLPALLALIGLIIGATFLGNFLYLRLLQLSGPSLIAKINYIVPFIALLSGWMFLHETIGLRTLISLAIIIIGLMIARRGEHSQQSDEEDNTAS